jgi:hypothetical protein
VTLVQAEEVQTKQLRMIGLLMESDRKESLILNNLLMALNKNKSRMNECWDDG